MTEIKVNFSNPLGRIKPMHAVNNGPVSPTKEQSKGNFRTYKALRIPYARNHDASFCSAYGGEHTVDVHAIFPNFDADETNPASYDFTYTDKYTKTIQDAGTEVYYRLGTKIEHGIKKYGTLVPKDFHKWARICEHIIRHYTKGWADGFYYKINYWEIWNEADGVNGNGDQPNWSGTPQQYYEMYDIASRHLKSCFPDIKIGGPALAHIDGDKWIDGFFGYITKKEKAPLDFFSWHTYTTNPRDLISGNSKVRSYLDKYGYTDTEIHCNEWNYVENFGDRWIVSLEHMKGIRGAAFTASVMMTGQADENCDMLMYYDARTNTAMNGIFDIITLRPAKGYYVFKGFSELYRLGTSTEALCGDNEIYCCAATDGKRHALMFSYYSEDKNACQKAVKLDLGDLDTDNFRMYTTDRDNNFTPSEIFENGEITILPDTVIFIADYMI